MEKAINSVDHFLSHNFGYNQKEIDQIKYVLNVLLSEISKVFLMFVFFLLFKMHWLFLFSTFLTFPIRITSGGLHFNKYWSCFAFSLTYFTLILFLSQRFFIHTEWIWPIVILFACINYVLGPISSPQRPTLSEKRRKKFRLIAVMIIFFEFAILWFFNEYSLLNLYIWVNIFHLLQLLFAKGVKLCQIKKAYI